MSAGETTEEARAFLQARAALFGLVFGGIGAGFLAWRAATALLRGEGSTLAEPSMLWHAGGAASMLLLWVVLRRDRSAAFVRAAESGTLLVGCVCYLRMGQFIPALARPDFILMLVFILGLYARVVFVPSSVRATFLLGAALAAAHVSASFAFYRGMDLAAYATVAPQMAAMDPASFALDSALELGAWWVAVLVLATLATRTIYGLRKDADLARRLGQYTLVQKIGEGGMGAVYRARHAMLRRPTAVKLLPPAKAGPAALRRFEKEVQLTASLTHPNTVTIFDYGRTPDGVFYYAMELLDGPTLEQVVALGGPLPPGRAVHVLAQAAGALAEAHSVGLIHRDVKPANIMLVERGGVPDVVKVVDFGLVKQVDAAPAGASLTSADTITGTPRYMSPEAIRSADGVDARSDIYALGAVGYFLLTGTHVFEGESVVEVCSQHLHTAPAPPSDRLGVALPPELEALVLSCLDKAPERRPQGAAELQRALAALAVDLPWSLADAQDWWAEHGERARPSRREEPPPSSGSRTFAVDLIHRAPSSRR